MLQSGASGHHVLVGEVLGNSGATLTNLQGGNYCYVALRRADNPGATKGHLCVPDGTILQYINNAAATAGAGTTINFDIPFNNLLSVVATPNALPLAIVTAATNSGVTLTTASGSAGCNVLAIGR